MPVRIKPNLPEPPPEFPRNPPLPRLYPEKAVIAALGISYSAIWRWRQKGKIKPVIIGTRVFYSDDEVQRLVREGSPYEGARPAPPGLRRSRAA